MKKLIAMLLAMVMVLALAACGAPAAPAAPEAPAATTPAADAPAAEAPAAPEAPAVEPVTLNVAYMPNYSSLVEVVTAIENGYFAEEGITVELVEFADGPTIIAAMEAESIDIGYIGSGAHKLCIAGRAKIFAFAHCGNGDAVIGLKSKGVETAADLKGKVVGYSAGTSSEAILQKTLASAGLTMDDITAMEMDASGLVSAMVSGSLDACALWSPSSLLVLEQCGDDAVTIANNLTFADQSASVSSWIVMEKFASENEEVMERYLRALYKAKDFRANPENARQISEWIAKKCGLDVETVYSQRGDAEWLTAAEMLEMIDNGKMEALYKSQQNGFIASGAVEGEVPVADYVMFDLMKKAAE